MKISTSPLRSATGLRTGFSLVELLVTMVTVVMVLGAITTAYLYALTVVEFTKPKLSASDEARRAISLMTEEIRGARLLRIGNGTSSTFTEASAFGKQEGSAIRLHPTTNYNNYVQYFWSSNDIYGGRLMRTVNGSTATYVVANSVSNSMVFRAENHLGQVLTNNTDNRVIAMELKFFQIQFPVTPIGVGNYYDFYQLRAKITRRTLL
jgi:type II secretory pathway component PulJ